MPLRLVAGRGLLSEKSYRKGSTGALRPVISAFGGDHTQISMQIVHTSRQSFYFDRLGTPVICRRRPNPGTIGQRPKVLACLSLERLGKRKRDDGVKAARSPKAFERETYKLQKRGNRQRG